MSTTTPTAWRFLWCSTPFWIGVLFTAVGSLVFVIGVEDLSAGLALRAHGIQATATVVSRRINEATGKNQPSTEYVLGYTFRTAADELMAGLVVVPVEQWEATPDGAPLQIHYLPDRPYESRLASDGGWGVAPGFVPLGALFAAIGLAFLIARLRRWRLVVRLLNHGAAAEGTVTHVGRTDTSINRVRQWRLEYEFADAAGERRSAKSDLIPPKIARCWKKGDRGPVRYDAQDPRRSIWVEVEAPVTGSAGS